MVVLALQSCHKNNIMHRDIKPENVLVQISKDSGYVTDIRLIDFGMACRREDASYQFNEHSIGTKGYVAPEVFEQGDVGRYDQIDSWALGVLLYNLVCGKMPYEGSREKVKDLVTNPNKVPKFNQKAWKQCS